MFDWTINEARRDRIAREVQKAIAKAAGRRDAQGRTLLPTPETVEALLGVLATLLEAAPQCATPEGVDATAGAIGAELAQLIRDVRGLRTGGIG